MTEDEFVERLVEMLKTKAIKWSDVPARHKEVVGKKVFGRYPMNGFGDLAVIQKDLPKGKDNGG